MHVLKFSFLVQTQGGFQLVLMWVCVCIVPVSALGVDFQMKKLLVDGERTTLQIWDTAGQERLEVLKMNISITVKCALYKWCRIKKGFLFKNPSYIVDDNKADNNLITRF